MRKITISNSAIPVGLQKQPPQPLAIRLCNFSQMTESETNVAMEETKKADYELLQQNENNFLSNNGDCFHLMNVIRQTLTNDSRHFINGSVEDVNAEKYSYAVYFSKNIHVKWNQPGLWCFVLSFDKEANFPEQHILHSWTVAVKEQTNIKMYMTHAVEGRMISNSYFQEYFKHIDYEKWMQGVVEMVRHVQKYELNHDATLMYENLWPKIICKK